MNRHSIFSAKERRHLRENTRIIHALDVEDEDTAVNIARVVEEHVDSIKISYPLIIKYGSRVILRIREVTHKPIIADFKVADIPEISSRIVKTALESGVDGVIVHGFIGKDSVKKCVKTAKAMDGITFIVVEMSHQGSTEYIQNVGEKIAKMAKDVEADGVITPATRPEKTKIYRSIVGDKMWIASPGIGSQGGRPGDAIIAGANFEIIGRSIYRSSNPSITAKKLVAEIRDKSAKTQEDV